MDPTNFAVTNTFVYTEITKVLPDEKANDQFLLEADGKQFTFKTPFRAQLLCQLYELIARRCPDQLKSFGPYVVKRVRKDGSYVDCQLTVASYGVVETSITGKVLQEYKFSSVERCGVDANTRAFFLLVSDRMKVFLADDYMRLYSGCREQAAAQAFENVHFDTTNLCLTEVLSERTARYASLGNGVSVFDVSKNTRRNPRPVPRQLHITEEFVVEKDSSGFQYVSCHKVTPPPLPRCLRLYMNPPLIITHFVDAESYPHMKQGGQHVCIGT